VLVKNALIPKCNITEDFRKIRAYHNEGDFMAFTIFEMAPGNFVLTWWWMKFEGRASYVTWLFWVCYILPNQQIFR